MAAWKEIVGSVTAAKGFKASGGTCGIKASGKPDIGILFAPEGAHVFGAFTQNVLAAPPVVLSRARLKENRFLRGVVVNSGNANACTGDEGTENAQQMMQMAERACDASEGSFLVCSTGVIGNQLPMDLIAKGIESEGKKMNENGGGAFSKAILTTDTDVKEFAIEVELEAGVVRIGGCSKGAGMIHPNMATMLAFITTDIGLSDQFQENFQSIVEMSFNSITVDGDTSTNDTCLLLSSGKSGVHYSSLSLGDRRIFDDAMEKVLVELAKAIVKDGEGATKFVEISVNGADTYLNAKNLGRFVANSKLVKTALFGKDPNWGRIVSAAATSGIPLNPQLFTLKFEDILVFSEGQPLKVEKAKLKEVFAKEKIFISLDLGMGESKARIWTCDLSYKYVEINAEYTT